MIIQIRSTSGGGKTWVMRQVMDALAKPWPYGWERAFVVKRKNPLYYYHRDKVVLGSYESTCGGCDNIGSARAVYELIQKASADLRHKTDMVLLYDFLCEGLLLSEDTKWSLQMPDLRVIFLNTPIEQCLRQIEKRRQEAGNEKPLNPENTTRRVAVIERARIKLTEAGVYCRRASPEQAVKLVTQWLKHSTRFIT